MPYKDKEEKKAWARRYMRVYRKRVEVKKRESEYNKRYHQEHKEEINARKRGYEKNRKITDIQFKIKRNLRIRLYKVIKRNQKVGSAVRDLGCSVDELKQHIEDQFQCEMSWDNYGEWHIDHIKPLASFDLTDREQLLEACHFTNLQPLWAGDNNQKGNKVA